MIINTAQDNQQPWRSSRLTVSLMPWFRGLSWGRSPAGPSGGWESCELWMKSFNGGPPPPPPPPAAPPPEGFT